MFCWQLGSLLMTSPCWCWLSWSEWMWKCSLTRDQLFLFNYCDHTFSVSWTWWHGAPEGSMNRITWVSVFHWRLFPFLHIWLAPGPAGFCETTAAARTHHNHLKYQPSLLCNVCPSPCFTLSLSSPLQHLQRVQLTRGSTSSPRCSPTGYSWDCARLPWP